MTKRNVIIVQVGNPLLRQIAATLSVEELHSKNTVKLISSLRKSVQEVGGVGLAAPQIGVAKRIFIIRLSPTEFRPNIIKVKPYIVINPRIVDYGKEISVDFEGCFSVADARLFAEVNRPETINVEYTDEKGKQISKNLSGLEARIFQHEYDHLEGKIFFDRETDMKTITGAEEYKKIRKKF